jgi:hypothetical protein
VIVVDQERSFLTHRGCIGRFSPQDIDWQALAQQNGPIHVHIAGYYNMPAFWNGNLQTALLELRRERSALQHGRTVVSLVPQHDATQQWDGGIDELLTSSSLDFLIMNVTEANRIMDRGKNTVTTPIQ